MKRMRTGGVAATALFAILATSADLQAQTTDAARAESLRAEAQLRTQSVDGLRQAANLYREAARVDEDRPEVAEDLIRAGRIAWAVGREGEAIRDLTQAAETALSWGDVYTAASAFIDAAWVAARNGRAEEAVELARRAEKLSHSPLIQDDERVTLRSRLGELLP